MSDPARDGYECHGPMYPLLSGDDGGLGLICTTCGITKNMVRNNPELHAQVDRALYEAAQIVSGKPIGHTSPEVFYCRVRADGWMMKAAACAISDRVHRRKRLRIRRFQRNARYWLRKANRVLEA